MNQSPPALVPEIVTLTTLIQIKDISVAFGKSIFSSTEIVIGSSLTGIKLERIKKLGSEHPILDSSGL